MVFLSSATKKSVLYLKLGHDSYLTHVHNPLFTDHPIIHYYAKSSTESNVNIPGMMMMMMMMIRT